ncbi:PREDICTED: microtubule-associated protein RP/EB family member 1-like [Ipomoea nil]|uniref:microtubule-associated protein RP/EB family member 1-like n=1 Tax=Ipomoea nil TaxID=35883 RepID=UPI0009015281|nr:PREDICTED: microtubule-associated protein RP/EB family member 1-like [Ipomoea nil]XP_019151980.1 PREDICTED: microtubule-associated protein RP/EB family member 1-like [Ipomoea nil]
MSSSSRTSRYLSRSDPPSKKSKVEKGKKSQAEATEVMPPPPARTPTPSKVVERTPTPTKVAERVRTPTPAKIAEEVRTPTPAKVAEGVTQPPPTRTPTAVTFTPQPPEVQGDTSNESGSRARTNLIQLGTDVPPGASLINKSLDAVEYAARIAPPTDLEHLVAMDVNMLQERYLRHIFEALLEGQIIHAQRWRVTDSLIEDVKIRDVDNKSLKDLLSIWEGALSKMEGELGVLRKEHQALLARAEAISKMEGELEALRKEHGAAKLAIVKEREDHERTRAGHADALGRAVETGAGQEAVEAEAQVAFNIGRYTKQQEIFSVLREKLPNFDPVSLGLPVIEKNPDPDAENESTDDVTDAREDSLVDEFHGIDTSNVPNVPLDQIMIEELSDHE